MKTLYCFGLLFLATVYRFINCVYFLSVQIMFVICLADDVDSGLPFYQSLECFCCVVAELHTIWPVGEMFCSDLFVPVGMVGVRCRSW